MALGSARSRSSAVTSVRNRSSAPTAEMLPQMAAGRGYFLPPIRSIAPRATSPAAQ
jgi:hypothetical protein